MVRTEAEKKARRTLRRLIDRLDQLPSVPVVAQKVAEMVHDPRQDAGSIAGVMKAARRFPSTTPARDKLLTTGESAGAMTSFKASTPLGVARPAWSTFSIDS